MDPTQPQPGHRLDRYELLCPLAYGGMASVWLARFGGRRAFERLVVVKMILPQYSQDPRFQEMFVDEARIASRIEHPNVARILDVGEDDKNTTYIVMEWIDGDSLSKITRAAEQTRQRIPAGIALRICADAAAGLQAAHVLKERDGTLLGVVHRDVSPQNILVSNTGSAVIIDFGVAKARDRVSQETSTGQLKGKIRYMAPEQALGRFVDHRADVFALGSILYELFVGTTPYDGPNEVATLHKLTSGAPYLPMPPSVLAPVRAVVDRALAYDVAHRFSSALELNVALEKAMVEIGQPTTLAEVANYTAQLLLDRKAARRRAVDAALMAAEWRDAERASNVPMSGTAPEFLADASLASIISPSGHAAHGGTPAGVGFGAHAARSTGASARLFVSPPAISDSLSSSVGAPSALPSQAQLGYGEVPSSATLGSTAMEYPPAPFEGRTRGRKVVVVALLGMSVVAGLVGVLLIAATTMPSQDGRTTATSRSATTVEAPDLPPTPMASATTATAALEPSLGIAAAALASATAGSPTASAAGSASPAKPMARAGNPSSSATSVPATSPRHASAVTPPARPKPVIVIAPVSTKPDRGF